MSGIFGLYFNLVGQCVLIKTVLLHSIYFCHSRKLNSFVSQIPSSLIALEGKNETHYIYIYMYNKEEMIKRTIVYRKSIHC